eukprot:1625428-Ditylum_brightwellii.AAC.1
MKFRSELIKQKIAPIIKQMLYFKVAQWCKLPGLTPPIVPQDAAGLALGKAIEEQADLGWHNFIKGRISKHWAETQQ